jgi:hypothetical protein
MNRAILKLCLAVLLAGFYAVAAESPARAQASSFTSVISVPFSINVLVPCSGDIVALSGNALVVFHMTIDDVGGAHVDIHVNYQGISGVASPSGAVYRAANAHNDHFNFNSPSPPPFEHTIVDRFNLIGRGGADNLQVYFQLHFTINANGVITAVVGNVRAVCR